MSRDSDIGIQLAQAAGQFIGCRFRLHGRDPRTGLDCVGLVGASLAVMGRQSDLPVGYALRNSSIDCWLAHAELSGFEPVKGPIETGDVLLTMPGPGQQHVAIASSSLSIVHAHAGLRRVVRQPRDTDCHPRSIWRLRKLL